jgi:uncharacterized repeat protein (TIGR01451 family)
MHCRQRKHRNTALAAFVLACLAAFGCRNGSVRVPRIDPTGQRIFAPAPSYTTLERPQFGWCPAPAYVDPPQAPPCPEGTVPPSEMVMGSPLAVCPPTACGPTITPAPQVPSGTIHAAPPPIVSGDATMLQVSPTRIIMQVGSEVVLLAGLCGGDGYFVTGEPVEWLLSGDSAGHFVEVGSEGRPCWSRLVGRAPKKLSGSYATGRTSSRAESLTRGTPDRNDDIWLLRGQTWVSVTSASEGTSRVTCLAPKVENWDHRTRTATIHWIDAEWLFPSPVVGRAGQAHTLATTVTRRTSHAPAVGWIVRYEIVDGPPAGFGPSGAQAVEVATDALGKGAVQIIGKTTAPGVTRVRVQVVRPPAPGDGLTRQVVGEGFTSVTWSASGLNVQVTGPPAAEVDGEVTYQIRVSNPGDLAASDVLVTDELPAGVSHLNSTPAGRVFGNRVEWNLGQLGPREARQLNIQCRVRAPGEIRHCVKAKSGEGVVAEGCAITRVASNSLELRMTGPPTAVVGQKVKYLISLTNRGKQPISNVRLVDTYDLGFQHSDQPSPIERPVGDMQPGQMLELAVTFTVVRAGQICHTLQITADGGHAATARGCLTATAPSAQQPRPAQPRPATPDTGSEQPRTPPPTQPQPRPNMSVQKTVQRQSRVGEQVQFRIAVTNTGNVPLDGVQIADQYPVAFLRPFEASPNYEIVSGQLVWTVDRIMPGQSVIKVVRCKCVDATREVCNRVTVTTGQGLRSTDEACLEILLPPEPRETGDEDEGRLPPIIPPRPPVEPRETEPVEDEIPVSGEMTLTVVSLSNPVRVGEKSKFSVTLKNDRKVSDKNVQVTFFLPEGVTLERLEAPVATRSSGADGRTIKLQPFAELRAGEKVDFMVTVIARKAGKYPFKATASSLRTAKPVSAEEDLTINVE